MKIDLVTVVVQNPADANRAFEAEFRVDAKIMNSIVPAWQLRAIGVLPQGHRACEMPGGGEAMKDVGVAAMELFGEIVGATVVFGPADCQPILGLTALQSVGIVISPVTQRWERLGALPLKRASNCL